MLSIMISACLISDPNVCKDHAIPIGNDVDPAQCALYAPPHFGQWADENPGWRIVKWRCGAKGNAL